MNNSTNCGSICTNTLGGFYCEYGEEQIHYIMASYHVIQFLIHSQEVTYGFMKHKISCHKNLMQNSTLGYPYGPCTVLCCFMLNFIVPLSHVSIYYSNG